MHVSRCKVEEEAKKKQGNDDVVNDVTLMPDKQNSVKVEITQLANIVNRLDYAIVLKGKVDMIMYLPNYSIFSVCVNVCAHAFLTSHAGKLPLQDMPFLVRGRLAFVSHYDRLFQRADRIGTKASLGGNTLGFHNILNSIEESYKVILLQRSYRCDCDVSRGKACSSKPATFLRGASPHL